VNLSRRVFLANGLITLGVAGSLPFLRSSRPRGFKGSIVGGSPALGHAVRDRQLPLPVETADTGIVIVGGGIAGLAAARRLQQQHYSDFVLLEMEPQPGGNAISGKNAISAFPWAAHYLPISGSDAVEVTRLLEELRVITGHDSAGLPIYEEEYLCADPMERLFIGGRWQEGLVPHLGIARSDEQAIESFFAEMQRLKSARGSDGRRAFTLPLDASSRDDEFVRLDQFTMADYLREKGWYDSAPLRWYVDYCCRDDYGAGAHQVSAWAGIHYFASRDGRAANAPGYAVVTWPEGNGWFVEQMKRPLESRIRSSCAVWNVEADGDRVLVDYYDVTQQRSLRLRAQGVVWAAPRFVGQRALRHLREQPVPAPVPVYSPWMVANLSLDSLPGGHGMDLSWDNVIYGSQSLGYVVATHQAPNPVPRQTVITYYQPLDSDEPAIARQQALNRSHNEWCQRIVAELSVAHPEIADHILEVDVWVWGHAMVRPVPGFIWGPARAAMQRPAGRIVFAHSDQSGIAIFEEAYTRGIGAANRLLTQLGYSIHSA
jgi:hypothetical protein